MYIFQFEEGHMHSLVSSRAAHPHDGALSGLSGTFGDLCEQQLLPPTQAQVRPQTHLQHVHWWARARLIPQLPPPLLCSRDKFPVTEVSGAYGVGLQGEQAPGKDTQVCHGYEAHGLHGWRSAPTYTREAPSAPSLWPTANDNCIGSEEKLSMYPCKILGTLRKGNDLRNPESFQDRNLPWISFCSGNSVTSLPRTWLTATAEWVTVRFLLGKMIWLW